MCKSKKVSYLPWILMEQTPRGLHKLKTKALDTVLTRSLHFGPSGTREFPKGRRIVAPQAWGTHTKDDTHIFGCFILGLPQQQRI